MVCWPDGPGGFSRDGSVVAGGGIDARMREALEFGAQAWDIACQAADEVADVFGFGSGELTNYPDRAEKSREGRVDRT